MTKRKLYTEAWLLLEAEAPSHFFGEFGRELRASCFYEADMLVYTAKRYRHLLNLVREEVPEAVEKSCTGNPRNFIQDLWDRLKLLRNYNPDILHAIMTSEYSQDKMLRAWFIHHNKLRVQERRAKTAKRNRDRIIRTGLAKLNVFERAHIIAAVRRGEIY